MLFKAEKIVLWDSDEGDWLLMGGDLSLFDLCSP